MRKDGRKFDQLRQMSIIPNYTDYAGSVLITMGGTKILCSASIQEEVPRWVQSQGKSHGWLTAEYAMLPSSTQQRKARETLRPSGRTMEIQRLIGRSLRAAINLDTLGPRTITIDCDVIQADGGTRTAAINGGYVALGLAMKKLLTSKTFMADPLVTGIAAVSVGVIGSDVLLDLNYEEDSVADADANIIMDGNGNFIEIQCTSERDPINQTMLDYILSLAEHGCRQIIAIQRTVMEFF